MNEHLGLCYSILRAVERKADEEAKITYAVERSQLAREVAKPAEFYLQQPNATLPSVLSSSLSSAIKHYKVAQQVALNAPKTPIPQKVAVKVAGQTGLKDFFQAKQDPPPAAPENGQGEHSDAWLAPTRGLVELYVVESMYSEAEAEVAKAMEFETQFSPEELRRFEAPQQKMQLLKRVSAEESDLCIAGNALLGESAFRQPSVVWSVLRMLPQGMWGCCLPARVWRAGSWATASHLVSARRRSTWRLLWPKLEKVGITRRSTGKIASTWQNCES